MKSSHSMTALEQAIIKTLGYFDIFEYPLTSWELYVWLYSDTAHNYTYIDVRTALAESPFLTKALAVKNGFYFLRGRESIVDIRYKRYIISMKKLRKLRFPIAFFSRLPFIRMIAVCNNLAFLHAREESDIDLFIVTKRHALPLVRILTVGITILFFKRPRPHDIRDGLCLSFIVDEGALNVSKLLLSHPDIYFLYWLATLQPVYALEPGIYRRFIDENRSFLQFVPNHLSRASLRAVKSHISFVKTALEILCTPLLKPFFCNALFSLQVHRLPGAIKTSMNRSSAVVVTHALFKSHLHDRRHDIKRTWERTITRVYARAGN